MLEPFGFSDASWSLRLGNAEGKAALDVVAETQITSANVGIQRRVCRLGLGRRTFLSFSPVSGRASSPPVAAGAC